MRAFPGAALLTDTRIVIPCFDEAERFHAEAFHAHLAEDARTGFLFVDDGSRDGTAALLEAAAGADPERMAVLSLPRNHGKAEAVRRGMLAAFEEGAAFAGYWDADLATPLAEIPRFRERLETGDRRMVLGARVSLLGRKIERSAARHYLGRVFATCASLTLRLPVYDTQCGAKLFRSGPGVRRIFEAPFASGWAFDVELLDRLAATLEADGVPVEAAVAEIPLLAWTDVAGSKVRPMDFFRSLRELARIRRASSRRRE